MRRCSRLSLRSLNVLCVQSRPVYRAALSPLLEKNIKVEWKVDFSAKYLCTNTQSIVDVNGLNINESSSVGDTSLASEGSLTAESEDSELHSTSSSDLHRISQRLGSVRNEETLIEAFKIIKNAEGTICTILLNTF